MKKKNIDFRDNVFLALRALAKENPVYEDAQMLVGSAEATASLTRNNISKSIDSEWVEMIESKLPALDVIIRNPRVAIEDVDEILPVELSRHITDKSIKHLATHTNLILDIKDDEVVPQKILNVYHDETYLTYENKFVNTLLTRLLIFVEKRYNVLSGTSGVERNYKFSYSTEFEHHDSNDGGRNSARIELNIDLTSPFNGKKSESNSKINKNYKNLLDRVEKIYHALMTYQTSFFVQKLGRNYIRPPVIRTNAILKNKDLKECLLLWEYIESFDKVGYSISNGEDVVMPTDNYITDLHSTVALQYVNFLYGVVENPDNRLLSKKNLFDIDPDFSPNIDEDELEDYQVFDSEYKKLVPVSRLASSKRKLSDDEKRMLDAITVALKADEIIKQMEIEAEKERLRLEEERRLAEEARLESIRIAEEERLRRLREAEEAVRRAEEERIAREKAQDIFAPEDGDYSGRYPICAYTRRQFWELGPKTKKQVKLKMGIVEQYRDLQIKIRDILNQTNDESKVQKLAERCVKLSKKLPKEEGWHLVLDCHTFYKVKYEYDGED